MGPTSGHALTITTQPRTADAVRMDIGGDLDLSTTPALRDALRSMTGLQATANVRLDLSRVTFFDCAAIGVLISSHHDAAGHGAGVAITAASPTVDRLLTLFDLGPTFGYRPRPT